MEKGFLLANNSINNITQSFGYVYFCLPANVF